MSGQNTFLKSNKFSSEEEIWFEGTPILETYEDGLGYLQETMPRYARLFAFPAIKRDGEGGLMAAAWYGEDSGQMQVWDGLDQTGKVRVATILRGFLHDLLDRIDRFNDHQASMVLGWLNILSFNTDLMVINGQPVITNWGIVPAGVASSEDRMTHHLMNGIGQFLPEHYDLADLSRLLIELNGNQADSDNEASPEADMMTPEIEPLVSDDGACIEEPPLQAAAQSVGSRAAIAGAAGVAGAAATGMGAAAVSDDLFDREQPQSAASAPLHHEPLAAGGAGGVGGVGGAGREGIYGAVGQGGHPEEPRGRICWIPVLVACIVALLILLVALIPGVLIYPYGSSSASLLSQSAIAQSEQALRNRISDLRSQLGQRSCVANPGLLGPDVVAGKEGAEGGMVGEVGEGSSTGPVEARSASDLVPQLDQATVLVLAAGAGGQIQSGSGFLISPDQIVTNRHVIEAADEGKIVVINESLGGVRQARILAKSNSSQMGGMDYALLKMDGAPANHYLQLTDQLNKGQQTYAAGFPGFFMETDAKFRELIEGNAHAAPSMVLTQGIVTVFQDSPAGLKLVLHSADISPGNSGGPLVDACGSVVGVNTFIKTSDEAQVRLNFALKSDSLKTFLSQNGVAVTVAQNPCALVAEQAQAGQ